MENTKIEWAKHTFNPWAGCAKVSEGCQRCYAAILANRFPDTHGTWGENGVRIVRSDEYWRQPLKWDRTAQRAGERQRVFCASMADVFEDRPDLVAPRARLFDLIDQTQHLDWLLLTKRPENIARLWVNRTDTDQFGELLGCPNRQNVWLGATTENQSRLDERWPLLSACRDLAPVLFLSLEPLLEPVILPVGVDWAIIGGESEAGARPFDVTWVRDFLRQCKILGTVPFVKQSGRNPIGMPRPTGEGNGNGVDPTQWPEDIRVREFPGQQRLEPSELDRLRAENTELRRQLDHIKAIVA